MTPCALDARNPDDPALMPQPFGHGLHQRAAGIVVFESPEERPTKTIVYPVSDVEHFEVHGLRRVVGPERLRSGVVSPLRQADGIEEVLESSLCRQRSIGRNAVGLQSVAG